MSDGGHIRSGLIEPEFLSYSNRFDIGQVSSNIERVEGCFESTETEREVVISLLKVFPEMGWDKALELLNGDVMDGEAEDMLPVIEECVLGLEGRACPEWNRFYRLLGMKGGRYGDQMTPELLDLYQKGKEQEELDWSRQTAGKS